MYLIKIVQKRISPDQLLPEWHKENMGEYKIFKSKQDIANVIRKNDVCWWWSSKQLTRPWFHLKEFGVGFECKFWLTSYLVQQIMANQDEGPIIALTLNIKHLWHHHLREREQALQVAKETKKQLLTKPLNLPKMILLLQNQLKLTLNKIEWARKRYR